MVTIDDLDVGDVFMTETGQRWGVFQDGDGALWAGNLTDGTVEGLMNFGPITLLNSAFDAKMFGLDWIRDVANRPDQAKITALLNGDRTMRQREKTILRAMLRQWEATGTLGSLKRQFVNALVQRRYYELWIKDWIEKRFCDD